MLKTVPEIRSDARAVLELPLAAIADYPGTVAVIDRYGTPSIAIGTASLVEVLQAAGRWPELVAASARVMVNGVAAIVVLADGPDNPIEATLLPLSGTQVLALLRPLDFEKALLRSLVESRQRYKDLIEIVSDFTWETDDGGCFTFISPRGALDWPASELVGRPVAEFLAGAGEMPEPPPVFRARSATEDGDVWFRRADGTSDCLSVAAVPLVDAAGAWRGARGACRKVTEQRRRERDAAHGHLRDRLVTHLSRTIGDEIDPQSALAAAASATGLALSASGAGVWRGGRAEDLVIAAQWGSSPELPVLKLQEMARTLFFAGTVELESDDLYLIGGGTRFHGSCNGAAILWRARDHGPFTAEDRTIVDAVADPFGVAIALLARHETTLALARTDPLTGLLNRRGFSEELGRRMARLLHDARPACLVYIDLDNFKLVNDTRGHKAGDAALIALTRILRESTRAGDVVARLGGDEFVIWFEGIGDTVAGRRAKTLVAACRPLAALSGDKARPLGVSLGAAIYDPARAEMPEALLARADAAMYQAKQQGKGSFVIAAPVDGAP
jgi:diguanylate cyclase (GGDEF)-like protein/PAS domain S-box-containing protein